MPRTLPDGLEIPDECPVPVKLGPPPPIPASAWALAGLALAVRAAAALLDPVPPRDSIALAETVRAVAGGDFAALAHASHPPLAALLASPLAALGLDPVEALALLAVLCGAAAVLPLHAVTRRVFDIDAANGAALLYAVTPPLVRLGSTALAEAPFLLLALLSLDAALRALPHWRPARHAAAAGLAAGAAWLVRPEALALLPLAAAAPLPRGGGRPWSHRLLGAAAAVGAFALAAGPWMAVTGGVVPGKSAAVLLGSAPPADPGGAAPDEVHGPGGAVLQAAGALPEALHPAVAVLAALGLLAAAGRKRCGKVTGPAALTLAASLLFLGGVALLEWRYGYGGRRHAAAAATMLLPFAGAGLLLAADLLGRIGGPLGRPVVAVGLLALGAGGGLLAGSLLQRDERGAEAKAMGLRLREISPPGTAPRIATFGEPRVAYYARGVDVRLLREFGVRPGTPPAERRRKADALRWYFRGRERVDFVALRDGDGRVPEGIPGPGTGRPAAEAGAWKAWRTADVR